MAASNIDNWFVPRPVGPHVLYLRRSNRPHSKLRIVAQRDDAAALIAMGRARIIGEFIEEEPLTSGRRPALNAAIDVCKAAQARLIFGKIDGMRGRFRWIKHLHEEGVYFMGADKPAINPRNFYQLERLENDQRRDVASKIKRALVKAKSQGATIGGERRNAEGLQLGPAASAASRGRKARVEASRTMSKIDEIRYCGVTSLTSIAARLNQMGHLAPRGGKWSPAQVRAVMKRCEE